MAYWRNYRKFSSEVHALALGNDSDEESVSLHPVQSNLFESQNSTISDQSGISGHSDISGQSDIDSDGLDLVIDSSDSSQSEVESAPPSPLPSSDVTLKNELAAWATRNRCTRDSLNQLLQIFNLHGHSLPMDGRTLLQTARNITTQMKCGGQYIYFGIEAGIVQILSKYSSAVDRLGDIDLVVNVDGLPLFKSTNHQFWPILGRFNNLEVFVIGLFYGNTKPVPVGEYLQDFIEEVNKLNDTGITHEGRNYKFVVKCFCCDAPARCYLKCIIGHTAYFACERCTMKGSWDGRVVFDADNDAAVLRTDELFLSCSYETHQKQPSPLLLCGVSCVKQFSLDYMHMVCLGVTKRILHYLKKGPRKCKLSSQQFSQISDNLKALRGAMPSEFARQPRSLVELERWKATEFRQFLLYTGPVVLKNVVSKDIYQHFLCLSVAISILLDSDNNKRNSHLAFAQDLLHYFVNNAKHVYGNTFTVYNVHSLKHLPEDVRYFKCSLNEISAFPFENFMQHLKKCVRNGQNPIVQVAKRLGENMDAGAKQHVTSNFSKIGTVSDNIKDSCFLLEGNRFAFVQEKRSNGTFVCNILDDRQLENFYSSPAESKVLNVNYVRDTHHKAKRVLLEASSFIRKAVCLSVSEGHVLFPLHHEVERC